MVMKKNKSAKNCSASDALCSVKTVFGTVLGLALIGAGLVMIFYFWDEAITVLKGISGVMVILAGAAIIALMRD